MVDVSDSKSDGGDTVWVQVPPPAPIENTDVSQKKNLKLFDIIYFGM